jgi:hypothetical protein
MGTFPVNLIYILIFGCKILEGIKCNYLASNVL